MSSSDRRLFLLGSLAALAGCGFEPALAPGGAALAIRGRIRADDPKNRNEFLFLDRFENRNGTASGAAFIMSYKITTREVGLAINQAQETTRFNVLGVASFTVKDATSGTVLTEGSVDSFTSYSATGTTVATLATQRNAKERLMIILADQVLARLVATSRGWAQ